MLSFGAQEPFALLQCDKTCNILYPSCRNPLSLHQHTKVFGDKSRCNEEVISAHSNGNKLLSRLNLANNLENSSQKDIS